MGEEKRLFHSTGQNLRKKKTPISSKLHDLTNDWRLVTGRAKQKSRFLLSTLLRWSFLSSSPLVDHYPKIAFQKNLAGSLNYVQLCAEAQILRLTSYSTNFPLSLSSKSKKTSWFLFTRTTLKSPCLSVSFPLLLSKLFRGKCGLQLLHCLRRSGWNRRNPVDLVVF